jgi:multiple sugar transport system substrate-binding protein
MKGRAIGALGAAALAGAALLTACSSSGGSGSSSSTTLTVEYWTNNDIPGTNATAKLIKAATAELAEQHPGVKVVTDPITTDSESQYYAKLDLQESSSSTSPDVVLEDSFLIGADSSAGYIRPLPQLASWSGWSSFPSAMQKIITYNGQIYGVMNSTDVQFIYYDVNLFKKAGIPVPWQPHSLADIVSAAKKLKAADSGITPAWIYTGLPLGEASSFRGFEVFLNGTGQQLYDQATGKWEVGGPGFTTTWNFLQAMRPYEEPESDWSNPNGSSTVNLTLMPAQKVGMVFDGMWVSENYVKGGPKPWPGFFSTYDVAKLPTSNGQGAGYIDQSGGWAWSVPARAHNPALALAMIEDMSSAQNLAQYDALDGDIPPRTDVTSQPVWEQLTAGDPDLTLATRMLQYTTFRPNLTAYTQISNEIATLTGNVASGSMTAAAAEAAFTAKVSAIVGTAKTQVGSG